MAFSFGNDWTQTKFTENKTKAHEVATAIFERAAVIGMDVDQNRWKFLIAGTDETHSADSYVLTKGVQSANDYTATHAQNTPRHEHTKDAGDSTFDLYYQFECGADKTINFVYLDGHNKGTGVTVTVALYNWTTASWDTMTTWATQAGDGDLTSFYTAATRHHILNDGVNNGRVRIRFSSAAASGGTLKIDFLQVATEGAKANPDLADYDGFPAIDGFVPTSGPLVAGGYPLGDSKGTRLIHQFRDAIEDLLRFNDNDRASGANDNLFKANADSDKLYAFWWDTGDTNLKTLANLLDKGSYGSTWVVGDDLDGVRLHENDLWEQLREALENMREVTWIFNLVSFAGTISQRQGAGGGDPEVAWDNAKADTPFTGSYIHSAPLGGSDNVPRAMWESFATGDPFYTSVIQKYKTALTWETANIKGDQLELSKYVYRVSVDELNIDVDMSDSDGNSESVTAGNTLSATERTVDKTSDPWPNIDGTDTSAADQVATIDTAEPADIPFASAGVVGVVQWHPLIHGEDRTRCRTKLLIGVGKILSIG